MIEWAHNNENDENNNSNNNENEVELLRKRAMKHVNSIQNDKKRVKLDDYEGIDSAGNNFNKDKIGIGMDDNEDDYDD